MNDESILAGIEAVMREHLDDGADRRTLDPTQRLVEDLQLDSVRLLTLAVEVENHFQVMLDSDAEEGIDSVGDLVLAIRKKLEEKKLAGDTMEEGSAL